MDWSALGGLAASLTAIRDIGVAAMNIRDSNLIALEVSKMNEALLNAQQRLFTLQSDLLTLQQENFEAREELRKVRETNAQRERYSLVEVGRGTFAYQGNAAPAAGGTGDPGVAEPTHYVCQKCLDGTGRRVVLNFGYTPQGRNPILQCNACKDTLFAHLVDARLKGG